MEDEATFNADFVFDDDGFDSAPMRAAHRPRPMQSTLRTGAGADGEEVELELRRTKGQTAMDYMIQKTKRDKKEFYDAIDIETRKYKELADVTKEKNSSVKQKELEFVDEAEDGFISIHSKALPEGAIDSFEEMQLSRALLKGITAAGYVKPTPIQATCIPLGLQGVDICACSATGTGKTAAFMLPILERLHFKPSGVPVTRVLIILPTRELALQVFEVGKALAQFTAIQMTLAAGGLDLKTQEDAVRRFPDVLIATPGRLIDMLENTPAFHLANIEILVLDEADRIMDDSFEDQIKEIVKQCAADKQTMLFSATLTQNVKDLALVSLNNPAKIFIDSSMEVAQNLQQQFVRIRAGKESSREAILCALLVRNFSSRVIVFLQTREAAKRLHIILGLLGLRVGELHGKIPQIQRMSTLRNFKNEKTDVLVATDLAARGLDIVGVKTVINFNLPALYKQYIHRVGRTARAGRTGVSVSLVGESERKQLKEILKYSRTKAKNRIVPPEVINYYTTMISKLEPDIANISKMVDEDEEMGKMETKLLNAEAHLEEHSALYGEERLSKEQLDEIYGKLDGNQEQRTWFQSHEERMRKKRDNQLSKLASAVQRKRRGVTLEEEDEGKNDPKNAKKRKQMKMKEKAMEAERIAKREVQKAQLLAARYAAREARKAGRSRSPEREASGRKQRKSVFNKDISDKRKQKRPGKAR